MALLVLEGFDHLDEPEDKYSVELDSQASIAATSGRDGLGCLSLNSNYWCMMWEGTALDTGVLGFAVFVGARTIVLGYLMLFLRSAGWQGALKLTDSGYLQVVRSFSTVVASSSKPIKHNTWAYIEVKFNWVNSIGADTFIVKINGEVVINIPAATDCQNAASSGTDQIYLQGVRTGTLFDDVYICDLTGSVNNDFLGDIVVRHLHPDGNGFENTFTGSDGNDVDNYLHVDDPTHDGDATYNECETTVAHYEVYAFENITETPTTIIGVSVDAFLRKDAAPAALLRIVTRVNSTYYEDIQHTLTTSYLCYTQVWEQNPDDSAAWAKSDINGAEFGLRHVV